MKKSNAVIATTTLATIMTGCAGVNGLAREGYNSIGSQTPEEEKCHITAQKASESKASLENSATEIASRTEQNASNKATNSILSGNFGMAGMLTSAIVDATSGIVDSVRDTTRSSLNNGDVYGSTYAECMSKYEQNTPE